MKALVLSGGGAKGAWQAGVLYTLTNREQARYHIVSGTSVGALNGAFFAQYARGDERAAAADLAAMWLRLRGSRSIYRKWYGGLLGRLPAALPRWLGGRLSMYSTAPLRRLVRENLSPRRVAESGRMLRVGAVDLITGARRVWSESAGTALWDAVLASSSFPVAFEPVQIDGGLYTDDGVREVTPVEAAIQAGADSIDVLICSPEGRVPRRPKTGIDAALRCLDAAVDEIEKWDLKVVDLYNGLSGAGIASDKRPIDIRILRPIDSLGDPLDFDPKLTRSRFELGVEDAKRL